MTRLSIGAQIDRLFKMREKIAADQKKVDEQKKKLKAFKEQLIETFKKQNIESSRGDLATVTLKKEVVPNPVDWDDFYQWMYEEHAGHMLYKRVSASAYREMLELRGGEEIPGLESFETEDLSIRRRTT